MAKKRKPTFRQQLVRMKACGEARMWVGDQTFKEAWNHTVSWIWMIWFLRNVVPVRGTVNAEVIKLRTSLVRSAVAFRLTRASNLIRRKFPASRVQRYLTRKYG